MTSQAWDAYYQKRTRECLALAKALLQTDPENTEAHAIQAAVRADLLKDLNDARALLEDSTTSKDDTRKRRKAAEVMLLKILLLDPDNAEAKVLLSAARVQQEPVAPTRNKGVPKVEPAPALKIEPPAIDLDAIPVPPPPTVPSTLTWAAPTPAFVPPPAPAAFHESTIHDLSPIMHKPPVEKDTEDAPFVVAYRPIKKEEVRTPSRLPFVLVGVVLVVAIFMFARSQSTKTPVAASASLIPAQPAPAPPVQPYQPALPTPVRPTEAAPTPEPAVRVSAPPSPVAYARVDLAPVEKGTLAVSSPTPAEIYQGDKQLGSTPTTLILPAGSHTLEYRYQDLRTVVSHVVKANETTTALVTFEIIVQINARPWAQVYLDGAERKPLGQTPLSNVRVPIGKVLVFENPNFPAKRHRVTGSDKAIQMAFP